MRVIPTRAQWEKWSLPSKYSAIGIFIGIISLIPLLIPIFINQESITATDYAKNTRWYLDSKSTAKNMPEEFKQLMGKNGFFKNQMQIMVEDTFGVNSDEYKIATSIPNSGNSLIEALLFLSKSRLVITDKKMTFITGINVKEMHNKSTINSKNNECKASSFEYKSVSGDITKVTKNGIEFNIPSQNFTEHSGCNSSKVSVDYLPAIAQLQGKILVVTHIEGIRTVYEKNGKKTIVRKDAHFFFNLKPENQTN